MTFVQIAGLMVVIALVLVVVPRIIFNLDQVPGAFLDRALVGGIYMTALTTAAMYILGTIGMLETLSLVAVWSATWWYNKGRKRRGRLYRVVEHTLAASDQVERQGASYFLSTRAGGARASARTRAASWWDRRPRGLSLLTSIAIAAVLTGAAAMRFSRALGHLDLVPQDSFLALSWTTSLNKGRVLADGTYPQSTYIWTSMLSRFYPFGVYNFTRWIGPTMNVLELVVLYWVVSRAMRNRAAGLLALAVFGMFAGHPGLFVSWNRQIGAVTQEFALAFALASLLFGAAYMASRQNRDLAVAGCALFVAATSNTQVAPLLALGYAVILVVGLLTGSWDRRSFTRVVAVGLGALIAANLSFALAAMRGIPLSASFDLHRPEARSFSFDGTPSVEAPRRGAQLDGNPLYQLAGVGSAIGIVCGVTVLARRPEEGRVMLAVSATAFIAILVYDLVLYRSGHFFRVRQGWVAGVLVTVGLGAGIGAPVLALESVLARRYEQVRQWSSRGVLEAGALVVVAVLLFSLWPTYSAAARAVDPSGYPQASKVAIDISSRSLNLTFTFVGVSEQYQEALDKGFFTEAWVFARDIAMHEARDPAYELAIPTESVYLFVEKRPFGGPQAPPAGPSQEYYRNQEKRGRIMARIRIWSESYRRTHNDMTTYYEDEELVVLHVKRKVDLAAAALSPAFKDYTWHPGQIFDNDADINNDVVVPDPSASTFVGRVQP